MWLFWVWLLWAGVVFSLVIILWTIFLFSNTFTSLAKDFLMFSYGVRWLAADFIAWAQLNADWLSLWLLSHSFFEHSHSRIFNRTVTRPLRFFENRIFEARGWSKELDDFEITWPQVEYKGQVGTPLIQWRRTKNRDG